MPTAHESDADRGPRGRTGDLVGRALLAYALGFAVASVWLAHLLHYPVLYLDQWRIHYFFFTTPFWEGVWKQASGHRILVPNLLCRLGNLGFSGDNEFLLVATLVFFVGGALILCDSIRRAGRGDATVARRTIALVIVLLAWFGNLSTLVWGAAGLATALPVAGTLAALFALARAREARDLGLATPPAWIAAAVASALVATFSAGQGPAVWPVLVLLSLLRRPQRRLAALFALVGCLALLVYVFAGTNVASDEAPPPGLAEVGATALVFLGALPAHLLDFAVPVRSRASLLIAAAFGVAGLLVAAVSIASAAMRRERLDRGALVILGFVAYCVLNAGIVGLARSGEFDAAHSLVDRYAVWSTFFWVGIAATIAMARPGGTAYAVRLATGATIAVAILVWPSHRHWIGVVAGRSQQNEEVALSIVAGVRDEEPQRRHLFWNLDRLHRTAAELRRRRLNLFRHEWSHLVGTRVGDRYLEVEEPGRALGSLTRASPVEGGGWRVEGWAWDVRAGRPPRLVLMVDRTERIRGLGRFTREVVEGSAPGIPEPGFLASVLRRVHPVLPVALGRAPGWFGYVAGGASIEEVVAFVLLEDGRSLARLARAPF